MKFGLALFQLKRFVFKINLVMFFCTIFVFQAIKRLMVRNSLTEEEAKARINSQMDNETIVKNSHVVFSSLWSYDYSQFQAEKAYNNLLDLLNKDGTNIKGVL